MSTSETKLFNRLPPHSNEAEMALLGSMILDPKIIPEVRASLGTDAAFYDPRHDVVFRALMECGRKSGLSFDLVTVLDSLRRHGEADQADPVAGDYLMKLAECVPAASNWPHYAKIVEEKARLRRVVDAAGDILHRAYHTPEADRVCSDALDLIGKAVDRPGRRDDVTIHEAASTVYERLQERRTPFWPTGLAAFDAEFGGLPQTRITTVLGVPGCGKSSLVQQWVQRLALKAAVGSVVFSYEMNPEQVAANMVAQRTAVPVSELLRKGQKPDVFADQKLREALQDYEKAPIHFVEDNLDAQQIYDRCVLYAKAGVQIAVVDYLQHLPTMPHCRDETASLKESCRIMRRIPRELGMAVVLVSQVTSAAQRENRPPKKSDGVGAGDIEQVSDLMIGVYRESVFSPMAPGESEQVWNTRKKAAQLHVIKNKAGPCGHVDVAFDGRLTTFSDPSTECPWK